MTTIRQFQPGEVIIQENEPGEAAYIIESGQVEVSKEQNGKRIHLGTRKPGEIFGEMSIIDEKPRSASVTAVTETTVKEIHRDDFLNILQSDQDAAVKILQSLFNRLREASQLVLQMQVETGNITPFAGRAAEEKPLIVSLEGLTPQAAESLPANPYQVSEFPFRIGRESSDPLTYNDLTIPDQRPYQLSRHHAAIFRNGDQVGVGDRGSTLGSELNGQRIGGHSDNPGPAYFGAKGGTLVLGTADSPYRYKVVIEHQP
jgi:hypothetical protein